MIKSGLKILKKYGVRVFLQEVARKLRTNVLEWFILKFNLPIYLCGQNREEFAQFMDLIPQGSNILEIGTATGWTAREFLKKGTVTSIDIKKRKVKGVKTINGDSQLVGFISRLKKETEEYDILFIDGDHRYNRVKLDFEFCKPLVKKGGIIGLHDICKPKIDIGNNEVYKFWQEIKEQHKTREFISDTNPLGIGVIYV